MFHIGILQLTENLDDAVCGFKDALTSLSLPVEYHYRNADGNESKLPKLAQELADQKIDLIFACSTPAAQAAQSLTANMPILFTPVFDPVQAGLAAAMNRPGGNSTGMSGMVRAADKVAFIRTLLPNAKKLGILYHAADANAQIETNHFRAAAAADYELTEIAVTAPEELSLLEEKLLPDLDALFLPIGKIIEENFSSIVYYTDAAALPIIASHAPNVVMGALGALVADHAALGRGCALQAEKILRHQTRAGEIPIGIVERPEVLLNAFAAESLGLDLPDILLQRAKEVYR